MLFKTANKFYFTTACTANMYPVYHTVCNFKTWREFLTPLTGTWKSEEASLFLTETWIFQCTDWSISIACNNCSTFFIQQQNIHFIFRSEAWKTGRAVSWKSAVGNTECIPFPISPGNPHIYFFNFWGGEGFFFTLSL